MDYEELMKKPISEQTLIEKLRIRTWVRRKMRAGNSDRIADLCEEAADEIERLLHALKT